MAANTAGSDLPLRRIALLSSGVAYFEHSGTLSGGSEILLPFDAAAVNDALKSLVVNDPASASPSVRYASENTLLRTLKSLKIDLSGTPGIAEILNGLKGAELEISAPAEIRGRIVGVEYRDQKISPTGEASREAWLSLFTSQGIRAIAVKDIASFRFTDEKINADLGRALDLIMASRDEEARNLLVRLDGAGSRKVSLSYVIPTPVWKVSYRLDLGANTPFLQGWAIVDNDSDTDWKDVELSLVTGRPVSFIQNLYPPLRLPRPVLPLSIAGIAESRTYESGYGREEEFLAANARQLDMAEMAAEEIAVPAPSFMRRSLGKAAAPRPAQAVSGGTVTTASASAAGDQFEFTLKNPVTLERRQSAMLPLIEGTLNAEKTLVFSGARASGGETLNPAISAEITNTSGMKLPAGPITVYDGGTYAGDALIEFFPENEKRLISYGEDLSVSGSLAASSGTRYITGVTVVGGIMTINRKQTHEKEYTLRNASEEAKRIIIEHPITSGAELVEPKNAEDRTAALYRFTRTLGAKQVLSFKVREESPLSEKIALAPLPPEAFLSYSTSGEIPAKVRAALAKATEHKKKADDAAEALKELESQRARLVTEQERIRHNLEAAGNQTPQGQEYLKRLAALDGEIDSLTGLMKTASEDARATRRSYQNYLAELEL